MKFNIYKILFFLFFLLFRCDPADNYIIKNDLIVAETNQVIEIKSIYFQNNIDNILHLDSLSFSWTSEKLLENKFIVKPFGDFGEKAYVTPIDEGSFEINLLVKHRWTGQQLNYENFIFNVFSSDENKYDTAENKTTENEIVNKIKLKNKLEILDSTKQYESNEENVFFVQFGAFKSKQKALAELMTIEKYLSNIFIIEQESLFKIRSGPYNTIEQAKSDSKSLVENFNRESWILQNIKSDNSNKDLKVKVNNIDVENLISYEDEIQSKTLDVENLISYEDEIVELEKLYIQIGTWKNKNQAIENIKIIKSLGFEPFIEEVIGPNNQVWNKVLIGPFMREKAEIFQKEISNNINRRVRIIK